MIKRVLCFTNPSYLSLRLKQIVCELPSQKKRCSFSNDSYVHSDGGGSDYSQQRAEKVGVMRVTDKQFGDMLLFDCKKEAQLHKPVQQLELF